MAYAVLVSLLNSTDKMLSPGPYRIIPCKKETIQCLHENIDSLMSFLENTPPHRYQTTKTLEANIREVGYKAEDILESYITNQSRSIYKLNEKNQVVETEGDGKDDVDDERVIMLSMSLVEVMKGFESLMEEMKKIQSNNIFGGVPVEQLTSLSVAGSSASTNKNRFVLLDMDLMNQIKEQLFYGESTLKVIPIVGMGGIGKTTLAKALIDDPFTSSHFDVRGWVTISQQYTIQDVVQNLLKDITGKDPKKQSLSESKVQLHKTLFKRRYVVVLDDLWDIEACDELQRLFPECTNGSRIMVTTRQSGVATFASKSYNEMRLLSDNTSWDLLCQEVFPQEGNMNCPPKLMEIGKEISRKCNGLPLTISVIGGLLSKGEMTQEHWKHVAENMKFVLTEDGDQCSEILSLSYNHLPHRLRACFLYMGIYPEDWNINVDELLQLWVVEGFLKPGLTDMKKVAIENLDDLIKRNLVMVDRVRYNGKPKSCKIHDLLRDLCIREARKEKFFSVWNEQTDFNHEVTEVYRRLSILPGNYSEKRLEFNLKILIPGTVRSLMCFGYHDNFESNDLELLRVIRPIPYNYASLIYEERELSSNLRWFNLDNLTNEIAVSIFYMWNLQYLDIYKSDVNLPLSLWCMPQLRHLKVDGGLGIPPPPDLKRPCVLSQLEVLWGIRNFRCDDEFLLRIPNLKELNVSYSDLEKEIVWSYYLLDNFVNMSKLEILECYFYFYKVATKVIPVENMSFPISLKLLTLHGSRIPWEHIDQIVGVLPNLQILQLVNNAFEGPTWETSEDHFKKLEYLRIDSSYLEEWIVEDSNHFPSLRYLYIRKCRYLKGIPTCIGEIPTLETIELDECSGGVVSSAKIIQDDYNDIKLIIQGKTRHAYEEDDEDDDKKTHYAYEEDDEDEDED